MHMLHSCFPAAVSCASFQHNVEKKIPYGYMMFLDSYIAAGHCVLKMPQKDKSKEIEQEK